MMLPATGNYLADQGVDCRLPTAITVDSGKGSPVGHQEHRVEPGGTGGDRVQRQIGGRHSKVAASSSDAPTADEPATTRNSDSVPVVSRG